MLNSPHVHEVTTVDETETYHRKDAFQLSEWKCFHDPAAGHGFFGIVCG